MLGLGLGVTSAQAPYSPLAEQGLLAWFNSSQSDALFQERDDSAGLTPALAGDPVGTWCDLSGNGFHAHAASDPSRPVRSTGLTFDGSSGGLTIPSLPMGSYDSVLIGLVMTYPLGNIPGIVCELGTTHTDQGAFRLLINASDELIFNGSGNAASLSSNAATLTPPRDVPFSAIARQRLNSGLPTTLSLQGGAQSASSTGTSFGGGTYQDRAFNIGQRTGGVSVFDGTIYELAVFAGPLSTDSVERIERYFAARAQLH
jgi:hypothetical protein